MKLAQLNEWYNRYQFFWDDWKNYKFNGLTKKDIFTIELYRDNHFRINNSPLNRFYGYDQIYKCIESPIVIKFQQSYMEYKEWVTIKFRHLVFRKAIHYGLEDFFKTSIEELEIDTALKLNLKMFKCENVEEIFDKYDDFDFLKDDVFGKILKFMNALSKNKTEEVSQTFDTRKVTIPHCTTKNTQ